MQIPETVMRGVEPWAAAYGDSTALQTGVVFLHLAGLLIGGGGAVAEDLLTLRGRSGGPEWRHRRLEQLRTAHRIVLAGLTVTAVTGVLMLAADLEALATSPVFWVKMGLVGLLLANGALMMRAEQAARALAGDADRGWRAMTRLAATSALLWVSILFVSVLLTNTA